MDEAGRYCLKKVTEFVLELLNIKFAFPQCVISVKSYKFDFIFHEWSFYKSVQRYGVFYINEKINSDKWEVNILSATY